MHTSAQITEAQRKIAELFSHQCDHGEQTKTLVKDQAACGQFLGLSAQHRGLHGTAAAILVLSRSNIVEAEKLVPRLVAYIADYTSPSPSEKVLQNNPEAVSSGSGNVIKIGELLYALSFVQTGYSPKDSLVQTLASKLLADRHDEKGWNYFLGTSENVDVLPTAFALLGLCRHGYESQLTKQISYLSNAVLSNADKKNGHITETSVRIFCLFALTFRKDDISESDLSAFRAEFIRLWRAHEPLMRQDIEQNIEYSDTNKNYYIRIPWQLYLLALAARLDPKRIYSSAARTRLKTITDRVNSTGFTYPYSGKTASSRTNAIIFDVFEKVKAAKSTPVISYPFAALDAIRMFFGRPIFSWLTVLAFIGGASYCIYAWFATGANPQDLGRGFTNSMALLVISFIIERLRKT